MDKVIEIIKFIYKSDKKTIKNKLLDILEYHKFCPVVLGQGAFGKAYIPESKNIEVNITAIFKKTILFLKIAVINILKIKIQY